MNSIAQHVPAVGTSTEAQGNRVYGLDIFRSLAILFVLVAHSLEHSKVSEQLLIFKSLGLLGVELFFVLSGFLIGGIIMRLMESNRFSTIAHVADFWKRRWLRTLPLYFLVLLAFLRFDYHGRHGLLDYPAYFVFMQSFAGKIPEFFELSWSLAIEEHFYLWYPLVFLAWLKFGLKRGWAIVLSALTFIAIAYAFRLSYPLFTDWIEYTRFIRVPVLSRLDAIMFGVLMAATKHYWPAVFQQIRNAAPVFASAFVVLCVWWFVASPGLMTSRAVQVNLFTFQAILCALLLPWFDGLHKSESSNDFFTLTSKLSYSLYLMHILVIIFVNKTLWHFRIFDQAYNNPFILYPLYFSLFYAASWATYALVEKPFLSLRDGVITLPRTVKASLFTVLSALLLMLVF